MNKDNIVKRLKEKGYFISDKINDRDEIFGGIESLEPLLEGMNSSNIINNGFHIKINNNMATIIFINATISLKKEFSNIDDLVAFIEKTISINRKK